MTAGPALDVRPYAAADLDWLAEASAEVGGLRVVSRGVLHVLPELPGFVAWRGGDRLGFVFHHVENAEAELVAIGASARHAGVGTALLAACERAVHAAGARRLWLITTNDNLDALRFYQRRGFELVAVHRGAVDRARELKPQISAVGDFGIPIRDEIELEKWL